MKISTNKKQSKKEINGKKSFILNIPLTIKFKKGILKTRLTIRFKKGLLKFNGIKKGSERQELKRSIYNYNDDFFETEKHPELGRYFGLLGKSKLRMRSLGFNIIRYSIIIFVIITLFAMIVFYQKISHSDYVTIFSSVWSCLFFYTVTICLQQCQKNKDKKNIGRTQNIVIGGMFSYTLKTYFGYLYTSHLLSKSSEKTKVDNFNVKKYQNNKIEAIEYLNSSENLDYILFKKTKSKESWFDFYNNNIKYSYYQQQSNMFKEFKKKINHPRSSAFFNLQQGFLIGKIAIFRNNQKTIEHFEKRIKEIAKINFDIEFSQTNLKGVFDHFLIQNPEHFAKNPETTKIIQEINEHLQDILHGLITSYSDFILGIKHLGTNPEKDIIDSGMKIDKLSDKIYCGKSEYDSRRGGSLHRLDFKCCQTS